MACMFPGAPDLAELLGEHRRRRRRGHRGAGRALGRRPLLRPRRVHERRRPQDAVQVGRLPRPASPSTRWPTASRRPRSAAIEPVQLLALEVAAPGAGRRRLRRRAASSTARATSVVFGAEAGTDLADAYGAARRAARRTSARCPTELEELAAHGSPRTRSPACSPTSSPAGSPTGSTSAASTTPSTPPAPRRWPPSTSPARSWPAGTSDLVLCGGADLHNGINDYLLFASVHALSPTGRCRTFDASADGIALGEGVAVRRAQAPGRRRARRRPDLRRHQGRRRLQRRARPRPDRAPPGGPAARPGAGLPQRRASRPPRSGWSRRTAPAPWSATAPSWPR